MAQSAANAAPHDSQNATVTIATSIAELSPSDAISKLGRREGEGEEKVVAVWDMVRGTDMGMIWEWNLVRVRNEHGRDGKYGKGWNQGHGQGISGGMMMTDSVGFGGAGGKSTMPVGLPWLEHEWPR